MIKEIKRLSWIVRFEWTSHSLSDCPTQHVSSKRKRGTATYCDCQATSSPIRSGEQKGKAQSHHNTLESRSTAKMQGAASTSSGTAARAAVLVAVAAGVGAGASYYYYTQRKVPP